MNGKSPDRAVRSEETNNMKEEKRMENDRELQQRNLHDAFRVSVFCAALQGVMGDRSVSGSLDFVPDGMVKEAMKITNRAMAALAAIED